MTAFYGQGYNHEGFSNESYTHDRTKHQHRGFNPFISNRTDRSVQRRRTQTKRAPLGRLYILLGVFVVGLMLGLVVEGGTAFAFTGGDAGSNDSVTADQPLRNDQASISLSGDRLNHAAIDYSAYDTVEVKAGDSLWLIAKEHKPSDMYIRDYIDQVRALNQLSGSILYEGMLLILP